MVKKMKLKQKINIDIYGFNIFEKWKDIIECKDEDSKFMREFRSLLMLITVIVFILVYGLIYTPIEYVVLLVLGKQRVEEINEKIKNVQDNFKYKDLDYYVELVKEDINTVNSIPSQYRLHKEILFVVIRDFPNHYAFFSKEQQSIEGVSLLAVSLSPKIFKYIIGGSFDIEVVEMALKKIPSNYYYCHEVFKENREFMLKILKANPLIYLPLKHFKDDEEFAYFALKRERMIFHFIPKSLKEQYGNNIEDFLYNLSEKFDKEEFYFSKMIRQ
jgi:hypothetical protein